MPAKQPASTPAQDCAEMLRQLFETSEASRKAATSLSAAASVGERFTDVPRDFRFHSVDGKPRFEPGKAEEPDFELTVPPGAARDMCEKSSTDVADLGACFLRHLFFAREPEQKIRVKVHSGLIKLTMHGWLRVVIAGCPRVILCLAQMGMKGPSALASALSRLKNGR